MKKHTIQQVKDLLETDMVNEEMLQILRLDDRKGVERLLKQYDKRCAETAVLIDQFNEKVAFDEQYRKHESFQIAGVDEAGRGPLAGPVVAAAVILPKDFKLIGLTDSKKVKEADRLAYFDTIKKEAISFKISIVSNDEIDRINIYEATKKAMFESLTDLEVVPDLALIDAVKLPQLPFSQEAIIKGDDKSLAIAAASILAKVTRDKIMDDIHETYPMYDLGNNKGYGTKKHITAIEKYGITKYHRQTFSPVSQFVHKLR